MTDANAQMRRYWNEVAGPRWVGLGGLVERRNGLVNDLLLARLAAAAGEQVLEIGCGTGATTVPVAAAVGATGAVVAADISEPMLAAARRAVAAAGLGNVTPLLADAQTHGFAPARFDLVFSRFGVMFFADPYAAFANLFAALKPGGRLCFACWAPLEENEHMRLPFAVAQKHLGPPAPKPPRDPGPLALADPDYVRDILGKAGFTAIAIAREHPDMIGGTPEEEAQYALTMGPSFRLMEEKAADPAAREAIGRDIAALFAARAAAGPIRLAATVLIVTATRPAADANAVQRRYWNEVAGPRRIATQAFIENRNRESNELLLARLGLGGGERVLEIGCGTGPTTMRLSELVGPEGRVLAVDISAPMLKVAQERVAALGLGNADFALGDAQVFGFEPAAFDLATSRMGVMFFADPGAAFANIRAALKPGGRLVFACWGPLADNPHWLISWDIAVRHLGPPAPRPAQEPGPHAFGDPDYLRGVLEAAGYTAIAIERAHPLIHGGTPEEETRQAMSMGQTARLMEEKGADPAMKDRIAREVEAAFAALAAAGPIRLASTIFLVSARRPE